MTFVAHRGFGAIDVVEISIGVVLKTCWRGCNVVLLILPSDMVIEETSILIFALGLFDVGHSVHAIDRYYPNFIVNQSTRY